MSRNRLHVNKLKEFEVFCQSEGWESVPTKGGFESLRMKRKGKTLLVHCRHESSSGSDLVHLTLHGESEYMFSKFARLNRSASKEAQP